jgi:plasmid segregation protein ParM
MTQIIGIDAGNYETKVIHEKGYECFASSIGEWRKRTVADIHSKQDMEFEIINKYDSYKGFAGPLATVESEYGGTVFGVSKNHQDANTRILLAVWRNLIEDKVSIVVGQPYSSHNEEEKNEIITALKGDHTVIVNGQRKDFEIKDIKVGIEGAMAFLANPYTGPANIIDVGSGTVNCIHFLNKRIVDRKCDTLPFGSETSKQGVNFEGMAKGIFGRMSGVWDKNHPTYICGGSAHVIVEPLKKYFPLIKVMNPKADIDGVKIVVDTKYSNAIGMYQVGTKVFSNDKVQTR